MSLRTILITGSTIGEALAESFASAPEIEQVLYTFRSRKPDFATTKIKTFAMDVTSENDIKNLMSGFTRLDGIINTVGFLYDEHHQPEKSISRFSTEGLMRSIELNSLPTILLAKHTLPLLRRSPNSIFAAISAKVGSIEDNHLGGWYSYRASKAALNMILKTLAIEWRIAIPKCTVAALHPGTVQSPLSQPFTRSKHAPVTPAVCASNLKGVIDKLTPEQTGRFWSWDGSELPW